MADGTGRRSWYYVLTAFGSTAVGLGAVIALVEIVNQHFAKQSDMETMLRGVNAILCVSDDRDELFSLQMKAGNLYARYVNAKVNLANLELSPDVNRGQIANQETAREDLWSRLQAVNEQMTALADKIKAKDCPPIQPTAIQSQGAAS